MIAQKKKLQPKILIEHGHDFFWEVILKLDKDCEWSTLDILRSSRANKSSIDDFVNRLVRAGFAKECGEQNQSEHCKRSIKLYRLIKIQTATPRLRRDGSELPEKITETLWRTMKMLKTFTALELISAASSPTQKMKKTTVTSYLTRLKQANIIAVVEKGGACKQERYRLLNNLGTKAPQILRSKLVYDPNADEILGEAKIMEADNE